MDAKKICSQFVDGLLKLANIDITGMMPDKVNPNTLSERYLEELKNELENIGLVSTFLSLIVTV